MDVAMLRRRNALARKLPLLLALFLAAQTEDTESAQRSAFQVGATAVLFNVQLALLSHFHLRRRLQLESSRRIRTRLVYQRHDYSSSPWARMLGNPSTQDASSRDGKRFRRRFRMPFPMFCEIVALWTSWFPKAKTDVGKRASVPVELLILGVLRILGRGAFYDDVAEIIGCSEETVRTFFLKFCHEFSSRLFHEYVRSPTLPEDYLPIMETYARLGFPGAIGSTDCTHLRRDRVRHGERNFWCGKAGFPTAAYELTCDFTRRILAVTRGHPGTRNDKTIIRFDGFVDEVRRGVLFPTLPFKLSTADGHEVDERGVYLITDQGYHRWRCLQCPMGALATKQEQLFSTRIESVRKDVECTFGILKGRFRILKLPLLFHRQSDVDNVFFTCCVLHNMLHRNAARVFQWEQDADWAGADGVHEVDPDADDDEGMPSLRDRDILPFTDEATVGQAHFAVPVEEVEEDVGFFRLRKQLIEHVWVQHLAGNLQWPRGGA